jgi:hypothetical protein
MSRHLIASVLVVPILLAAAPAVLAGHCCPGHGEKAKAEGEKSAPKATKTVEPLHGGMMSKSGDHQIETVMRGKDVRVYVYDSAGKPVSTKKIGAKAWVVPAKGRKVALRMKHVAAGKGRTQTYLAGTTDLDYAEDAGQKLSVSLSGLGADGKGTASFDVAVRACDTVTYQCPMHGAVKSEDPGKCLDCGMALKRSVTKAVAAKKATAEKTWVCPMHPEVTAKKAGDCPKCGMKLKVRKTGGAGEKKSAAESVYTCPMHPDVKSNAPGKCPECSMALRKVTPGKDAGKSGGGCGGCGS